MRFEDEQYVRLYVRDTTTWLMMNWQAKCCLPLIFRKLDRAGLLPLDEHGLAGLAAHIQVPLEVVEPAVADLLRLRVLVLQDGILCSANFIEAQECKQSDKARRKASRDRARDIARAVERGVDVQIPDTSSRNVTSPPAVPTPPPSSERGIMEDPPSRNVTPTDARRTPRPTGEQNVTLNCAVLNRSEDPLPPTGAPTVTDREPPAAARGSGSDRTTPSRYEDSWWRSAYEQTVVETLGTDWGFPDKQLSGLRKAVTTFCKQPAAADAWIRREVANFVEATRAKASVWGAFGPDGFLRWLNAGRPDERPANSPQKTEQIGPVRKLLTAKDANHSPTSEDLAADVAWYRSKGIPLPPDHPAAASTSGQERVSEVRAGQGASPGPKAAQGAK